MNAEVMFKESLLFQQFQDLPTMEHRQLLIIKDYCLLVDVEEEKERELFRCKGEADVDESMFLNCGAVVDDYLFDCVCFGHVETIFASLDAQCCVDVVAREEETNNRFMTTP